MHSRSGMFLALWNGERRCTAWVRGHPDRMQRYPPSQERGQCPPGCSTQAGRPRSQGVPRRGSASSVPSETRRGRDARAPRVCPVVGVRAACPRRRDAGGTPALPGCAPSWECEQRALGDATRAGRPRSQGVRRRGSAGSVPYRGGFLSPCVPSFVSAIRTPRSPLLPLWEKGVGGMRGKSALESRKSRIAPRNATLEGRHRRMGTNTGEPRIVFYPI